MNEKDQQQPYISSPQCAMRDTWLANWARERGNLASEPSEPADGLLIMGKTGEGN